MYDPKDHSVTRCSLNPDLDPAEFSKALPIAEVSSEAEARRMIVRFGRLDYSGDRHRWSGDEFDGTLDGIRRVEERIREEWKW